MFDVSDRQLNLYEQEVQTLAKRYHTLMNRFYDCSLTILYSLGNMYVDDPRFKATYDKYDEKLAEFLRDALHIYCAKHTTC